MRLNKFWITISGMAALTAILSYFGIVPGCSRREHPVESGNETHNITSYDQKGGITAHTVTLQKSPRDLKDQEKQQLLKGLSSFTHRSINIRYSSQDREAFNYANQIKNFLIENGWSVKGPNTAMFFSKEPRVGVNVKTAGEGDLEINVYSQG